MIDPFQQKKKMGFIDNAVWTILVLIYTIALSNIAGQKLWRIDKKYEEWTNG